MRSSIFAVFTAHTIHQQNSISPVHLHLHLRTRASQQLVEEGDAQRHPCKTAYTSPASFVSSLSHLVRCRLCLIR
jgi:hypothetical protein